MAAAQKKQQQRNADGMPSPLDSSLASRQNEKDQMVELNNRMAIYVEKTQLQGIENSRLKAQKSEYYETHFQQVNSIKAIYASELSEARLLLDQLSKEKAQLQLEVNSFREKYEYEKNRANNLAHDHGVLEGKLKDADALISSKTALFSRMKKERDAFCSELDNLRAEATDLKQELESTQQMLENESLQRVDFENKLQSAKEELLFKERLHREEEEEAKRWYLLRLKEVEKKSGEDYTRKLEIAIMDLRELNDVDRLRMKDDLEEQYNFKINELQKQVNFERKALVQALESSKTSETKVDRLQCTIRTFQNKNNSLTNRIQDLEGQVEAEREIRVSAVMVVETQRDEVQAALLMKEKEYVALWDVKLQLDQEISVYRKLLEEEERRLNLTSKSTKEGKNRRNQAHHRRKRVIMQSSGEEIGAKRKMTTTTYVTESATLKQALPQAEVTIEKDVASCQQVDLPPEGSNTCIVM